MREKASVEFDPLQPLFVNGNGGGLERLLFNSTITKHIPTDVPIYIPDNPNGILFHNVTVLRLFEEAYADVTANSKNRIISELSDSFFKLLDIGGRERTGVHELDIEYNNWLDNYTFCYNLYSSVSLDNKTIHQIMKNDLNSYFSIALGIYATVEERLTDCWVLEKIGDTHLLTTKGRKTNYKYTSDYTVLVNKDMGWLTMILNTIDTSKNLIDITGIKNNIDLYFPHNIANSLERSNEFLKKYGLRIENKSIPIEIVVLKEIKKDQG